MVKTGLRRNARTPCKRSTHMRICYRTGNRAATGVAAPGVSMLRSGAYVRLAETVASRFCTKHSCVVGIQYECRGLEASRSGVV